MNSFHVKLILHWSEIFTFFFFFYLIISAYFKIFVLTHDLPLGFIIAHSEKKVAQNRIA